MSFTHYQQHDQMDRNACPVRTVLPTPIPLRMVAKHYGRGLSIQKLLEATQIGKEIF